MKFVIKHESGSRLRIHACVGRMTLSQADIFEYYLKNTDSVMDVTVYDRTCDVVIFFTGGRDGVIKALSSISFESAEKAVSLPRHSARAVEREFEDRLFFTVALRLAKRFLLPAPLRAVITAVKAVKYAARGVKELLRGRITVPVLDAAAISVSVLRGDFSTASSVMFLLNIGDILDEWTHKKAVNDLAQTMSLGVEKVWKRGGGADILTDVKDIRRDDVIVVRTGGLIPLDGTVAGGEATVNQASLTGESEPVLKKEGGVVYAGTAVDEGELLIRVTSVSGSGRYDRIVRMIEESEKLKSSAEARSAHIADSLVPYSLFGTAAVWLITRNAVKALAVLMVDFSCALKLSMPIAVLSAMKECRQKNITVKGGKALEAAAEAETVVFDKTGTLTEAIPTVKEIYTFGDESGDECLRLAACLEEHFPHSIASAVVGAAKKRGLRHDEHHAKVEYVVAHGIASSVDGVRCVIGSHHFVFEDEGCVIPEDKRELFDSIPGEYSQLYLAVGGRLAAVICIEDPVRPDAAEVIRRLHRAGVVRTVMMTGDSERTAASVAARVGVDEYHSEVLPDDKAEFIRKEHEAGRKVMMIGDGVNDSPALSEADCGIAVSSGAEIAREAADVTINGGGISGAAVLRETANALAERINRNYRVIMSFNFGLITLGVLGIISPPTAALAHNISTLLLSLSSMKKLLK